MKNALPFLLIFLLFNTNLFSQNINGRISSSLYSFERFDTTDVSNTYLRSFQTINLNINEGKFSFRTYLNLETDLTKNADYDPRVRFYNMYFEGRNLYDILSFKLGRQTSFNNVSGGLFDGINIDLKKYGYKLSGFFGGNVPSYQKFEFTDDIENDYLLGGKFTVNSVENFQFALGYINKNFKPQEYWAARLDADLNPIQVLIRNSSNQYEFASGEISYDLPEYFSIDTRLNYDLNFEAVSKFEIFGEFYKLEKLKLNAYYNYREPKIFYNSIFSVFNYGNSQEIEAGADYELNKSITVTGKFGSVQYESENSQRLTAGLITNYGTFSYRKTFGYAGELDALSLYSAYTFLEGLITPSLGLSYTSYKLSEDAEKNTLVSILAGTNYRPWRFLSFDIQGQFMNNKIYKNDYRFFFKANYWFNTNF
jgi:hypothetical protein